MTKTLCDICEKEFDKFSYYPKYKYIVKCKKYVTRTEEKRILDICMDCQKKIRDYVLENKR